MLLFRGMFKTGVSYVMHVYDYIELNTKCDIIFETYKYCIY